MMQQDNSSPSSLTPHAAKSSASSNWKLFLVLAICAAPMIASYLTYYVIKPQARTNYGTILDPRLYPLPTSPSLGLEVYKGKWIMLTVHPAAQCTTICQKQLHDLRQLRSTQGKDSDRIERAWLITDDAAVPASILPPNEGTRLLRVAPAVVNSWLPKEAGTEIGDHLYIIDPLGNLVMRFPKAADPNKIKKDLSRLLKASSIG